MKLFEVKPHYAALVTFDYPYPAVADSPCILWMGRLNSNGYALPPLGEDGSQLYYNVHKEAWIVEFGPASIPEGWQLDHLCRRRSCINIIHLEPVTTATNNARRIMARGKH